MRSFSEVFDIFGDIFILEGEDNIFDEYNTIARNFKELYDANGKSDHIKGVDRLYFMNKEEIVKLFISILQNKNKTTIIVNTTDTRKSELRSLFEIAKKVYGSLKTLGHLKTHNIAYLIEQYNKEIFKEVSNELDIPYIKNFRLSSYISKREELEPILPNEALKEENRKVVVKIPIKGYVEAEYTIPTKDMEDMLAKKENKTNYLKKTMTYEKLLENKGENELTITEYDFKKLILE